MITKSKKLKELITSKELTFLMEAHNGLSAKIVEESGFSGIWASGLSISAQLCVRDNNEASWTQVLEVLEFMSDATNIPILLDGDTGYGNFNNMRRLVQKLEQRNIAGVCIEDKLFPKTNSFINGESQPLADMNEFCGKIKAAKDQQKDRDFVVVARIEAFIAGWPLEEALKRAEAYRLAGADAILVHSKKSNDSDIVSFMKEWKNRAPVIIVPTKYYSVPTEKFEMLGVNTVIWANHNIRACVKAMKDTTKQIFNDRSLINVEDKIVSVSEIFRLQGEDELRDAEKLYLPKTNDKYNAIILAATQGNFGELTTEIPKTLLNINGKSILETQITALNKQGIKDISIVRGFKKEKINFVNLKYFDSDKYESTKELYSLKLALDKIETNTLVSFGDIIYKDYVLNELLSDDNDITIICDADFQNKNHGQDFVITDKTYLQNMLTDDAKLIKISHSVDKASGEFIGMFKVSGDGAKILKNSIDTLAKKSDFDKLTLNDLFNEIVKEKKISVKFIKGSWLDIDTIVDLQKAGSL